MAQQHKIKFAHNKCGERLYTFFTVIENKWKKCEGYLWCAKCKVAVKIEPKQSDVT